MDKKIGCDICGEVPKKPEYVRKADFDDLEKRYFKFADVTIKNIEKINKLLSGMQNNIGKLIELHDKK